MQQTMLGEVMRVVRYGDYRMCQLFEFFDRTSRDARRSLFVHGMDDDAIVIERQNAVRLIAVREKSAGDSVADYERDHGMAVHAGVGIGVGRRRCGQKDRCSLIAPAISLALHIDDAEDWALAAVPF